MRGKLSNSGDTLKLLVPSCIWKYISGWINYSCTVIIHKIIEILMGNRVSKSVPFLGTYLKNKNFFLFSKSVVVNSYFTVKEQRIDGSLPLISFSGLRCILKNFERNSLTGVPSNHLNRIRFISSLPTQPKSLNQNFLVNPWFITGSLRPQMLKVVLQYL